MEQDRTDTTLAIFYRPERVGAGSLSGVPSLAAAGSC